VKSREQSIIRERKTRNKVCRRNSKKRKNKKIGVSPYIKRYERGAGNGKIAEELDAAQGSDGKEEYVEGARGWGRGVCCGLSLSEKKTQRRKEKKIRGKPETKNPHREQEGTRREKQKVNLE